MKASDYIVQFLAEKGIRHVFGYPGGMVTHLMDSLQRTLQPIQTHLAYHEQGAAMAACGYAQTTGMPGVAFATSGPGATNLITGIGNAFFDSIPTIFITGQVNTYESKGELPVRQKGFQETNIVSMVKEITKYSVLVQNQSDLRYHLEKAWSEAVSGRPGPVLLDIPMNIQRADICVEEMVGFLPAAITHNDDKKIEQLKHAFLNAKRPCIVAGAGIKSSGMKDAFALLAHQLGIPVVTSMLATDVLPNCSLFYGFVGAYGQRAANFILSKSDCVLSLGSRLDIRQTGAKKDNFAPAAKLFRVDIDNDELSNKIKPSEVQIRMDLRDFLPRIFDLNFKLSAEVSSWIAACDEIHKKLEGIDKQPANAIIEKISTLIPPNATVTTDVGQNQVWVAQSFLCAGQNILYSGGHGAMGYSLPAAIGAWYGSNRPVYSFTGDGGLQMNIQELQFLVRENIPVKIILLNNQSLGMIRHFQEMYFESNYTMTQSAGGYLAPDFCKIAAAYGIPSLKIYGVDETVHAVTLLSQEGPALLEIMLEENTFVFPKLAMGKPNEDQDPPIDRVLYEYLQNL